jgi:hypothetical protein
MTFLRRRDCGPLEFLWGRDLRIGGILPGLAKMVCVAYSRPRPKTERNPVSIWSNVLSCRRPCQKKPGEAAAAVRVRFWGRGSGWLTVPFGVHVCDLVMTTIFLSFDMVFHVPDVRDIPHMTSGEKLGTVESELSPAPGLVNS